MKRGAWITKQLGSLKMAVIIIFLLAAVLVVGTLYESYYSRAYAYNLVYGAVWFQILLLVLGVNILAAAILRLPFKKRLAGFYISHLGLLLLLAGSLLTLIFGIDGTLTLPPGQTNNLVRLDEPVLYVQTGGGDQFDQIALPKSVFPLNLDKKIDLSGLSITIKRFLPYAKEQAYFQPLNGVRAAGFEFTLFAPQVSTHATLSSPPSDYPESVQFGPLKVINLGTLAPACKLPDEMPGQQWLLITPDNCYLFATPSQKGLDLAPGLRISALDLLQTNVSFRLESSKGPDLMVPAVSAWPLKEGSRKGFPKAVTPDFTSSFRLYFVPELLSGNAVMLFFQNDATQMAVFNPPRITTQKIDAAGAELPWMKLRIAVDRSSAEGLPYRHYVPVDPVAGEKEHTSAVAVDVDGSTRWLASGMDMVQLPAGDRLLSAFLGFKTIPVPWGFSLERFKMDRDPGTNSPASYESFVKIRVPNAKAPETAHIYMNNPLKKGRYTFYQASYFQVSEDTFGSVLQVNYDPGRILKYAGSLILVGGTILHFYIRRTRRAQAA